MTLKIEDQFGSIDIPVMLDTVASSISTWVDDHDYRMFNDKFIEPFDAWINYIKLIEKIVQEEQKKERIDE